MSRVAFRSKKNAVYFIAEVGGNHEGDPRRATELVDLAIESGADAVKLQIYTGDSLVSRVEGKARNEHFKKFELSEATYHSLAQRCEKSGVAFMASIWSEAQLEWANDLVSIHKVGSGDLTAYPLLRAIAQTSKPIILSTGLSTMADVEQALSFLRQCNEVYLDPHNVAVLQCTSCYPTDDDEVGLRVMKTYAERFGIPVGLSDHSLGSVALLGAVAFGASIVEKHFTDTREGKTFRDHLISLTRDEVRLFLNDARRMHSMLGTPEKCPTPGEIATGHLRSFRRSVYAAVDIRKGEKLGEHNLTVLRPNVGIGAERFDEVIGCVAQRDIAAHHALRDEDVL